MFNFEVGQIILVRALHADGRCYRWWKAMVERVDAELVVTVNPAGHTVFQPDREWVSQHHFRAFYWLHKPYNLLEVYAADGSLHELYINVASPPTIADGALEFTDHELDVSKLPDQPALIVDADEFEEAIGRYGYSAEFQAACWAAAETARELAERWQALGWSDESSRLTQ